MHILIYGAGGVGGYYGGRLAESGVRVSFIARGSHLEALRKDGLRVESVSGDFQVPVEAAEDPADLEAADFALIAVKTWQVEEAVEHLASSPHPPAAVATLQNGVEAPFVAAGVVGRESVLPGTVKVLSFVEGPGRIKHVGGPGSIAVGEWDNEQSPRVKELREKLKGAGLQVEYPDDIHQALWEKFIFIGPTALVGALSRAPLGVFRGVPEVRDLVVQAMGEIQAVAGARGIELTQAAIDGSLALLDSVPVEATASLQRDIMAGRPSELDAFAAAVIRMSDEAGLPAPFHHFAYGSLLPMEQRARGELTFPDDD